MLSALPTEDKRPSMAHARSATQAVRVAYVLTSIDFGGSDRVSLNFLKRVDRRHFEIVPILLTRPWEADNIVARELRGEGYQVQKVPVALHSRSEGGDRLRHIRCFRIMRAMLMNGAFNLVHTHGYFADIVGIPAAKSLGMSTLSTCHGFIANNRKLRLYNALDRFTLRFADRIIAVSDGIKEQLVQSHIADNRIEVIFNAVSAGQNEGADIEERRKKRELLNIGDDEWVVGYVGRLSPEKGVKTLLRAAAVLVASGVPLKILIIGEGPEQSELAALAEQSGLPTRVIFAGFQDDPGSWMPALDVFCLPSLTEGTPMSLLEAMAHGVPIVASEVGGIPQVIQSGRNGVLVPPNQPEALHEAIARILADGRFRKDLTDAGRETIATDYNIDDWTRRIEELYERLARTARVR